MYSPPSATGRHPQSSGAAGPVRGSPRDRGWRAASTSLRRGGGPLSGARTAGDQRAAGSSRRLFFGLWPPAGVSAALSGWVIAVPAAHRTPAGQLHLTVLFLGAVPAVALSPLLAAAAQVRSDPIGQFLDRLEYWPEPRVLCAVGSASAPLVALRSQLLGAATAAGIQPPDAARPLVAHVTLARRRHTPPPEPGPRAAVNFTAASFSLIESRPRPGGEQRYVSLADWPLASPAAASVAPVFG